MKKSYNLKSGSIVTNNLEESDIPKPKSEKEISLEVREKRDLKLKNSDWTQVSDAPVDQAAWATYRQALRDIPSQAGFPNEVTWPTEPEV
jgi:hypothetical protein